jgi:uncharacterized protein
LNYRVEDIPQEGLLVQGERDEIWLRELFQGQKALDFTFISPISFKLHLTRSDFLVLVDGFIKLNLGLTCSRCLEQFIFSINYEFKSFLSPANFKKLPLEMELSKEDLDMEFYSGDSIDLRQIIQNQIILSIPFNPLCGEDCKGLCPHCGINRNRETCECTKEEIIHPKLLILKDFFKK